MACCQRRIMATAAAQAQEDARPCHCSYNTCQCVCCPGCVFRRNQREGAAGQAPRQQQQQASSPSGASACLGCLLLIVLVIVAIVVIVAVTHAGTGSP
jgi:hypothetical protein